jgi:hypothetical protein
MTGGTWVLIVVLHSGFPMTQDYYSQQACDTAGKAVISMLDAEAKYVCTKKSLAPEPNEPFHISSATPIDSAVDAAVASAPLMNMGKKLKLSKKKHKKVRMAK